MPETQLAFTDDPKRERLLRYKLGSLLTWQKPVLTQTIGPFEPHAFDPFDTERRKLIAACIERLHGYTGDEVTEISAAAESITADKHGWSKFLSHEINALIRRTPPWFAGGFGHPDRKADFAYWTKMPKFDFGELTCLSIGISPAEYSWQRIFKMTTSKERAQFWPPLEFLVKRYEQLYRKFGLHGRDGTVRPNDFIAWASQFAFEVHPDFWEPLTKLHLAKPPMLVSGPPGNQDKREVDSIAQLFTAMAIDYLGYNPKQARSPATKEITELAASMGMSISEDTVLKYLRIGAKFISEDWVPEKR